MDVFIFCSNDDKKEVQDVVQLYENKSITVNEVYPEEITIELKNGLYILKDRAPLLF